MMSVAYQSKIHKMAWSKDMEERKTAAWKLRNNFDNLPDKKQAWDDLHCLTSDNEIYVRRFAIDALDWAFPHVPDKKKAWEDLIRLTSDTDSGVRIAANHSLGRVSIFRASEADEYGFKREMEDALGFFEKASKEATYFNPAKFCLPFYRSFYALAFKKEEAEAEVHRYLSEAKNAVQDSKSKKMLLEAVEN